MLAAAYMLLQANVFVVGDPDQAIYGWRGANVVNMQQSFNIDYPGSFSTPFCVLIVVARLLGYCYPPQFLTMGMLQGRVVPACAVELCTSFFICLRVSRLGG